MTDTMTDTMTAEPTEAMTEGTTGSRPTPTRGRRTRLRVLVAALASVAVGFLAPGAAYASGTQDNKAVAVNSKDGSSLFKFAFSVARVMGDSVTNTNAAVAYASCTDCQTTAIAIQVVIVAGDPSTFAPTNTALAINEACDLCDTLASAYQFVVQTSGPVHFNADGNKQLRDIRRQLAALRTSTLSSAEMQARLDDLTAQLQEVLRTDLVAAGPPRDAKATSTTSPNDTSTPSSTTTEQPDGQTTSTTSPASSTSTTATSAPSSTTTSTTSERSTTSTTSQPSSTTSTTGMSS